MHYPSKVLSSMHQINPAALGTFLDKVNKLDWGESSQLSIYEEELEWLDKRRQYKSISEKLATEYVAALHQNKEDIGKIFAKRFELLSNALGSNNPEIVNGLPEIAEFHERNSRFYDAMQVYRRIVEIDKIRFGPSESTKNAIMKYSELLLRTNDPDAAERARIEAQKMSKEVLTTPRFECWNLAH
ncbi:MAG: hypothetical protein K2X93_11975 [Candidatus Obscuribacterales bacterium]|nr:hypothetical protein [Candidatus Obscuribacterales bacterium]